MQLPETIGPELLEPLIRVLGLVDVGRLAGEFLLNVIPGDVVAGKELVGALAHVDGDGLDVVANLLGDNRLDVLDLGVLEAEFVTEVGVDLGRISSCRHTRAQSRREMTYNTHADTVDGNDVLDGGIALGLVQAVAA